MDSSSIVPACAVIAFWIFLAVVSVAGMMFDYRKKTLAVESLKIAADRGQHIDPAVIHALLSHQNDDQSVDPRNLAVGGVMAISAGVGLMLASLLAQALGARLVMYVMLGAGIVAICAGIGLLISSRILARPRFAVSPAGSGA